MSFSEDSERSTNPEIARKTEIILNTIDNAYK